MKSYQCFIIRKLYTTVMCIDIQASQAIVCYFLRLAKMTNSYGSILHKTGRRYKRLAVCLN